MGGEFMKAQPQNVLTELTETKTRELRQANRLSVPRKPTLLCLVLAEHELKRKHSDARLLEACLMRASLGL